MSAVPVESLTIITWTITMAEPQTSPMPYPDQYTLQPNVEFIFTSDESWSHVEDMALRRRIQNKAAQRRYRTLPPIPVPSS